MDARTEQLKDLNILIADLRQENEVLRDQLEDAQFELKAQKLRADIAERGHRETIEFLRGKVNSSMI